MGDNEALDVENLGILDLVRRIEDGQNHFETLGVPYDAPVGDFRNAYFAIAQTLHPDRLAGRPDAIRQQAAEAFDKARAAWEELKDDETRTAYIDRVIHGKKSEDEMAMEKVQLILEAEGIFKRGLAAFNAGQLVKAHSAFEEAFKKVPEEPEFGAYYGYTLYRTNAGRSEQAAEDGLNLLKQSLEKGKKMDAGWVLMGRIFRDRGDEEKAKRCFVQSLRINASNSDAARELERMKRSKEKAEAPKGGFLSKLFQRKKDS